MSLMIPFEKKKRLKILLFALTVSLDMTTVLASLTPDSRKDVCIHHALRVRSAWALNHYHSFFRLYTNAPKMSGYLMDWFAERCRKTALKAIIKSYVFVPSTCAKSA